MMGLWEEGSSLVAWKMYYAEHCIKELWESMDRCTGCSYISETVLKKVLDTT